MKKKIMQRYKFVQDNPLFKKRIIDYYEKKASEDISVYNQSEIFAEESIYKKFTSQKDNLLMKEFHSSKWENRNDIKNKFSDERLIYFANMLMYYENPECLDKNTIKSIKKSLCYRLLSQNKEKWLTLYDAYKKIDDLREKCDNENDTVSLQSLNEINEYLEAVEYKLQADKE